MAVQGFRRQLVKMLVDRDVAPVIRSASRWASPSPASVMAVYKHGDPRAHAMLEALARAGAAEKLHQRNPERIAEATGEFVNIDYALAVWCIRYLPPGNELVLFAMARTVGWIAHASEQLRHGGRFGPRAPHRSGAGTQPGFEQVMNGRIRTVGHPCDGLLAPARSHRHHAGGGSSTPPARQSTRRRSPPVPSNAWRSRHDAESLRGAAPIPRVPPAARAPAPSRIAAMLTGGKLCAGAP